MELVYKDRKEIKDLRVELVELDLKVKKDKLVYKDRRVLQV